MPYDAKGRYVSDISSGKQAATDGSKLIAHDPNFAICHDRLEESVKVDGTQLPVAERAANGLVERVNQLLAENESLLAQKRGAQEQHERQVKELREKLADAEIALHAEQRQREVEVAQLTKENGELIDRHNGLNLKYCAQIEEIQALKNEAAALRLRRKEEEPDLIRHYRDENEEQKKRIRELERLRRNRVGRFAQGKPHDRPA